MTDLLKMDISQFWKEKKKRLALKKQIKLIQLMNNLFASGFQLTEILHFLERSKLIEAEFIDKMKEGLENGESLSKILQSLKFSSNVVTQLALAEEHGNIQETLALIEKNLRKIAVLKNKMIQLGTYPVILLTFLLLIMLGMKNYLIPQISNDTGSENLAMLIISNLPILFFLLIVFLSVLAIGVYLYFRKKSALEKHLIWVKIPLFKNFLQLYLTAYFSREWGLLISQGLELRQILDLSSKESSEIFAELGEKIKGQLFQGQSFHSAIRKSGLFKPELALMVEYGEMKGKLGRELELYSEECWESFFFKMNQLTQLIQPLVFLFVALAIVLIYVAMLLPIYQNIDMKI